MIDPSRTASAPSGPAVRPELRPLDEDVAPGPFDPATVILTCANCGAAMDQRACKLICRCGYFLSCSDYY